jgi:hypothetical protein
MGSGRRRSGTLGSVWTIAIAAIAVSACSRETPSRRTLFDFESDEGWKVVSGDASVAPSLRLIGVARHGKAFLGTGEIEGAFDIARHGVLQSPVFAIDHDFLVFRAGGVGGTGCTIELVSKSGKRSLRKAENPRRWKMETHVFDVGKLRGKSARLRLVDRVDGKPCSVHLDWVRLVDG